MEEYSGGGSSSSNSDDGKNCRRGHWRPAEDERLRQLVQQFGPRNWNSIADKIEGRTGKSCRLRWFNQLDPRINRKPFSEEEEERLLSSHRKYGNKWSLIARLFPGRTDNAVKNHYHVIIARQRRERPRLVHSTDSNNNNTIILGNNISQDHYYWRPQPQPQPQFVCNSATKLQINPKTSDNNNNMFSISSSNASPSWTNFINGSRNVTKSPSLVDHSCLGGRRTTTTDFINSSFPSFTTKERSSSHCWDDDDHNHHRHSSLFVEEGRNQTFVATKINNFEGGVDDPHSLFGFSNLGIGYNGTSSQQQKMINNRLVRQVDHDDENLTPISKWQMVVTQQEGERGESTKHNDVVPFIDFLGVGVSS